MLDTIWIFFTEIIEAIIVENRNNVTHKLISKMLNDLQNVNIY